MIAFHWKNLRWAMMAYGRRRELKLVYNHQMCLACVWFITNLDTCWTFPDELGSSCVLMKCYKLTVDSDQTRKATNETKGNCSRLRRNLHSDKVSVKARKKSPGDNLKSRSVVEYLQKTFCNIDNSFKTSCFFSFT